MKIRTNAQLIAELQKHPTDALVVFHDVEGDSVCLGDITMDGTCGDGSPEQPYECLRISLTEDPKEEFESLPVGQVEPEAAIRVKPFPLEKLYADPEFVAEYHAGLKEDRNGK